MLDNELLPKSGYGFSLANRIRRNESSGDAIAGCFNLLYCLLIPANNIVHFGFIFSFSEYNGDVFFLSV